MKNCNEAGDGNVGEMRRGDLDRLKKVYKVSELFLKIYLGWMRSKDL